MREEDHIIFKYLVTTPCKKWKVKEVYDVVLEQVPLISHANFLLALKCRLTDINDIDNLKKHVKEAAKKLLSNWKGVREQADPCFATTPVANDLPTANQGVSTQTTGSSIPYEGVCTPSPTPGTNIVTNNATFMEQNYTVQRMALIRKRVHDDEWPEPIDPDREVFEGAESTCPESPPRSPALVKHSAPP
ncbi:hypothetical protein DM01DRAFT_330896 [Hesseltinella vesiculosa]|uniref:Uncharacterized protein n=1 Tax=Hesseltinella vesiculosa TaxID=101127 RepID=A0A1X2GFY9_9FUNG|nr:hypothetical protein DM01DRAFT_330896 [Hesseltinella vesiculosa]